MLHLSIFIILVILHNNNILYNTYQSIDTNIFIDKVVLDNFYSNISHLQTLNFKQIDSFFFNDKYVIEKNVFNESLDLIECTKVNSNIYIYLTNNLAYTAYTILILFFLITYYLI